MQMYCFPVIIGKKCPFTTHPLRKNGWPVHHSPIKSIADGGSPPHETPITSPVSSPLHQRTLTSFPVSVWSAATDESADDFDGTPDNGCLGCYTCGWCRGIEFCDGCPECDPPDSDEPRCHESTGFPVGFRELPRYVGIVTHLNIGKSDADRGHEHVF